MGKQTSNRKKLVPQFEFMASLLTSYLDNSNLGQGPQETLTDEQPGFIIGTDF